MSAQGVSAQVSTQTIEQGTGVLFKLVLFSLSLGIVPITSYFASEKYIWNGREAAKPLESRKDR
ncbi:hypothetical protein BGY98DRAFT_946439 [Russula aff. rugulosa BPL654]|nr:hypothetical protein BGY98DRAFT_946439 [Russula aff. rugulosa BPL654]